MSERIELLEVTLELLELQNSTGTPELLLEPRELWNSWNSWQREIKNRPQSFIKTDRKKLKKRSADEVLNR